MMGVAFEEEFLKSKAEKAVNTPAFQNTFRTMYLSQWVGAETAFVSLPIWDDNDHTTPLPAPGQRTAFGGLDLSSTTDLSAFAILTRNGNKIEIHLMMYAPEEGLVERERRDKLPYREWVRNGWLKLCSGTTIDQDLIKADVYQAMDEWDLVDIGYDRWNASKLVREMTDDGVKMVEFGQGYANMSAPTKSFLQLVAERKFMTGGNLALRTQLSNTSATTDAADNVKPDKAKSSSRIDGVIATIMALDGLNRRGGPSQKSAYEEPFLDEETVDLEEDLVEELDPAKDTQMKSFLAKGGRVSAYEDEAEE
jgi:phage terminase large subunit-like protein